jgi:hypothetical protein
LTELLYLLALWQGLAKLRLHTEGTLAILDNTTRSLGIALRAFKHDTCSMFKTKELRKEAAARMRRAANAATRKGKGKEVAQESADGDESKKLLYD